MFKQFIATLALCFAALVCAAQNHLLVKIVDQDNQAVVGATVRLEQVSSATNERGEVEFKALSAKIYRLSVTHLGYKTSYTTVDPSKENDIIIKLLLLTQQTGDVFVYGTRAKELAPTTFRNITKEEIRKSNLGQDIPFLLDQTPGVVVGSDAGAGIGYTNMTIRGSDNQRINVTLNGIPLNDAESMGSFFVNLPDFASSVQSIQVQRGIGASTNGAGAFGASLNIQTDVLEVEPFAEFNNSFGSYNSWKNTLKVGSGLLNNKYAFHARVSRIASDGYIDRATSNLKSFYVDGGLYTKKHILKATVFSGKEKTYQAWYGTPEPLIKGDRGLLPEYAGAMEIYEETEIERLKNADRRYNYYTYDNQTDNYTQTHSHLHYTNTINDKLSFNTALHYTRGAGYYEEYRKDDKLSKYNIPPQTVGSDVLSSSDLIRQRWLDNHFYGLIYGLNYNPTSNLKLALGGGYNQYQGGHYGKVIWAKDVPSSELGGKYYYNDAEKNDFNIFAKADYTLHNLLVNVDIQYRNVNYLVQGDDDKIKDLNFEDNLNFINPKVGFTYLLNAQSNFYASYAFANKEPVRKDYVENPLNEFPRPEKMQNVEAGYRFRNEHLNVGTNVYGMFYKDQLIPTGALNDTGGALRFNIPKSYRIGFEFDGSWKITKQYSWSATAALSQNKIINFQEQITIYNGNPVLDYDWDPVRVETINYKKTDIAQSPSVILSNNFTYHPIASISLSLLSKYISRTYLDNTTAQERSIAPSFVNNIRASYTFSVRRLEQVDLNLTVNNILNAKYQTSGYTWGSMDTEGNRYHYNFYYPQAETNFMLGLNIRF